MGVLYHHAPLSRRTMRCTILEWASRASNRHRESLKHSTTIDTPYLMYNTKVLNCKDLDKEQHFPRPSVKGSQIQRSTTSQSNQDKIKRETWKNPASPQCHLLDSLFSHFTDPHRHERHWTWRVCATFTA